MRTVAQALVTPGAAGTCTVLPDEVPAWAPMRVEHLYRSLYATNDYAELFDGVRPTGTLIVGERRHVALYTLRDGQAWILTRVADFPPETVASFCAALFETHPKLRRVRVEVLFDPAVLPFHFRVLVAGEDWALDLPATRELYENSLGSATRRHLRQYRHRLHRDLPELQWHVVPGAEVSADQLHRIVGFNRERMRSKGIVSGFEREPGSEQQVLRLITSRGLAGYWCADPQEPAAGVYCVEVGTADCGQEMWAYVVSHDPALDYYHLGLLCMAEMIATAIAHRNTVFHMGWTTPEYKMRLGARRRPTYTLAVYRDLAAYCSDVRATTRLACERATHSVWWWRFRHLPSLGRNALARLSDRHPSRAGRGNGSAAP